MLRGCDEARSSAAELTSWGELEGRLKRGKRLRDHKMSGALNRRRSGGVSNRAADAICQGEVVGTPASGGGMGEGPGFWVWEEETFDARSKMLELHAWLGRA